MMIPIISFISTVLKSHQLFKQITDVSSSLKLRQPNRYGRIDFNTESWVNMYSFMSSVDVFAKILFSKHSFRNTIRVTNSLEPDQVRRIVRPDLGANCLLRLLADDTARRYIIIYFEPYLKYCKVINS